jgi:lipoyltransferase/lipoate-protein ligase
MKVFVSPFQNPFINLALEDYFLRNAKLPLAFFYINRPCVVLGRFQNPWLECHLPYLVKKDIWLVRRQSGGGCVYHDEGNLNYSFLYPEGLINRRRGVELIQKAFSKADIPLTISERHDLWLKGKKISGSAFKQTKEASFHHGTFLVSSDLKFLDESLKYTVIPKKTKSIASVRSQVTRLMDHYPESSIQQVIELIAYELKAIPENLDGAILSEPEVQKSFIDLRSEEWLWGETPHFELGEFEIYKGKVIKPFSLPFTRESMKEHLIASEWERYFPDFSEQHSLSNQIL